MRTTQNTLLLKAFLEATIPKIVKRDQPELSLIDSVLGGYCIRALHGDNIEKIQRVFTKDVKHQFSELINHNNGEDKSELVIYYKLATLVEEILLQYYSPKEIDSND